MADESEYRPTNDRENAIQQAHSVKYLLCGHCPNVHLLLEDEDGEPMAIAVMSESMLLRALELCFEAQKNLLGGEENAGGRKD